MIARIRDGWTGRVQKLGGSKVGQGTWTCFTEWETFGQSEDAKPPQTTDLDEPASKCWLAAGPPKVQVSFALSTRAYGRRVAFFHQACFRRGRMRPSSIERHGNLETYGAVTGWTCLDVWNRVWDRSIGVVQAREDARRCVGCVCSFGRRLHGRRDKAAFFRLVETHIDLCRRCRRRRLVVVCPCFWRCSFAPACGLRSLSINERFTRKRTLPVQGV